MGRDTVLRWVYRRPVAAAAAAAAIDQQNSFFHGGRLIFVGGGIFILFFFFRLHCTPPDAWCTTRRVPARKFFAAQHAPPLHRTPIVPTYSRRRRYSERFWGGGGGERRCKFAGNFIDVGLRRRRRRRRHSLSAPDGGSDGRRDNGRRGSVGCACAGLVCARRQRKAQLNSATTRRATLPYILYIYKLLLRSRRRRDPSEQCLEKCSLYYILYACISGKTNGRTTYLREKRVVSPTKKIKL